MQTNYHTMTKAEKIYAPIEQKTFKNALKQFFVQEMPQIGGEMILELITDKIETLIDAYYPDMGRLTMGQILWFAVDENERGGYGKAMSKIRLKPVVLTLVSPSDISEYKNRTSIVKIKEDVIARLYREAQEQGAVLAESDISLLLHYNMNSVCLRTKAYEKKHQVSLPRRGTVHDLGRSISHKKIICRKRKLERKTISEICRETDHNPESVTRYTTDLERVLFCLDKKISKSDIPFITKLSPSLTQEYISLIIEINDAKKKNEIDDELPF